MNHELIMLRECKHMRRLAQSLSQEAKYKAIKSYMPQELQKGTLVQIEEISRIIQLRDECLLFWQATVDGLNATDADKRLLLVQYYLKRMDVSVIADKLKTSVATVYRSLHAARKQFKANLLKFGCDEQWFADTFGHIEFISNRMRVTVGADEVGSR